MNLEYIDIDGIKLGLYKDGPVGISVSGGADSAIMLYLLMKYIPQDLHIYNLIKDRRRHALEKPFDDVVAKCAELTGKQNYFIHKLYGANTSPESIFKYHKERLDEGQVDIIYFGLTKFPPNEIFEQWEEKLSWSHVKLRQDDGILKPVFGVEIPMPEDESLVDPAITISGKIKEVRSDKRIYVPFVNYNKKDIAKLYKAEGVEKELFPVSRSCENDDHPGSHCGKCWWCNERLWGFGYLE